MKKCPTGKNSLVNFERAIDGDNDQRSSWLIANEKIVRSALQSEVQPPAAAPQETEHEHEGELCWTPRQMDAITKLVKAERERAESKGLQIERILTRQYDALAICPDHRDKHDGRCIVCVAEERTKVEPLQPAAAAPPIDLEPDDLQIAALLCERWGLHTFDTGVRAHVPRRIDCGDYFRTEFVTVTPESLAALVARLRALQQ